MDRLESLRHCSSASSRGLSPDAGRSSAPLDKCISLSAGRFRFPIVILLHNNSLVRFSLADTYWLSLSSTFGFAFLDTVYVLTNWWSAPTKTFSPHSTGSTLLDFSSLIAGRMGFERDAASNHKGLTISASQGRLHRNGITCNLNLPLHRGLLDFYMHGNTGASPSSALCNPSGSRQNSNISRQCKGKTRQRGLHSVRESGGYRTDIR